jgi:hypothetical protein
MMEIQVYCVLCEVHAEAAEVVDHQACRVKPPYNATLFTAFCGDISKFCIIGKFCTVTVMDAR